MSENNLNNLIQTLKSEAIEAAENQSDRILEKARKKAQQIVQTAEEEKESILAEAERESAKIIKKGEAALRQAGRDYSISVRNELLQVFESVFKEEVKKEFSTDLIKNIILKVIESMRGDVEVTLSPQQAKDLSAFIHQRLKTSDQTVSIIESNAILSGFTITKKTEGWSYTISPEEVTEALKNNLNKNWLKILNQDNSSEMNK